MTRGVTRMAALLPVLLLAARPLAAQEVTARARVDSTAYLIGDWITVRVEITHPPGIVPRPMVGDTLNGFVVVRHGVPEGATETETRTEFVVARYDSGTAILPPLVFLYSAPGDTATRTVSTNPLVLTVRTVPVDTSAEIRDVKPPMTIPLSAGEIALMLAILLVLAGGVYAYVRYRRRPRPVPRVTIPAPPPRPAHVIALEELAVVKEKKLWQQGLVKQYYSEVTEVVRRYFENRFRFIALEQTTEEIMSALRRIGGTEPIREESERMLRTADLVKFAKYQPGIADHEELLRTAYDIVETTRSSAAPTPAAPQGKVSHAGA